MAVKDTSLAAFFKDKTQRSISTIEARVLGSLYVDGPATRLDLAKRLDKPINCITAPVLALIKAEIIEEHDRVVQPETGNKAWQLKVKEKYALSCIDHGMTRSLAPKAMRSWAVPACAPAALAFTGWCTQRRSARHSRRLLTWWCGTLVTTRAA